MSIRKKGNVPDNKKELVAILSNQLVIMPMLSYLYSDLARHNGDKLSNKSTRGILLHRSRNRSKNTIKLIREILLK
jgi:hypothetical protein